MSVKKKECPSCAMMIETAEKICPICGYDFPGFSPWIRWVALLLILLFILFYIL